MGIEFELKLDKPDQTSLSSVEKALREAPYFSNFDEKHGVFYFNWDKNLPPASMPNLSVSKTQCGLILCFNGGSKEYFDEFIGTLAKLIREELAQDFSLEEI